MQRKEINQVLASAGLRPQHRFGQNFMVDETVLAAIADAGQIGADDVVLEVGPGVGNLTRLLAARAAAVLAVDIDDKLMAAAQRHHAELKNVTWLRADVLSGKHEVNRDVVAELQRLHAQRPGGAIRLVSNLPYNAASPLVAELLVLAARGEMAISYLAFTVQWEVAQRLAATPGSGDYGPLGVLVQLMAQVEIVRKILPGSFWPPPKVNSALVTVMPERPRMERVKDAVGLQRLLAGVFGHRRQTLHNALKHFLRERYTAELAGKITAAGIDLKLRPEGIMPEQFLLLNALVG